MSKVIVRFEDPDAIYEIVESRFPTPEDDGDISPNMEAARDNFEREYFLYGDYGYVEIDTETMSARLLTKKEWKEC